MLPRKYVIALLVCLLGLIADQAAKTWVYNNLSGKVPAKEKIGPPGEDPADDWGFAKPAPVPKRIEVIENFVYLDYAENMGMAFGMFQDINPRLRIPLFVTVTAIATLIIIHLLGQAPATALRLPLAMGLILAGAFGNLIDRFRFGPVVDFIKVIVWPPRNFPWPTFNLADIFITTGILLLLVDMFIMPGEEEPAPADKPTPSTDPAGETPSSPDDSVGETLLSPDPSDPEEKTAKEE